MYVHREIVRQCRSWGHQLRSGYVFGVQGRLSRERAPVPEIEATNYDRFILEVAAGVYLEIMQQCLEWGATDINRAMDVALEENHNEIVQLCLVWFALKSD